MDISDFFPEDTSTGSLMKIQTIVAHKVRIMDDFGEIMYVGAADQAFFKEKIISCIVVMDYGSLSLTEQVFCIKPICFPYRSTFLSFREGPAIVNTFKKLKRKPDVLFIDGAGINHPRGAGLAAHIGVALDVPTIGITKKILCGKGIEPVSAGENTMLIYKDKQVGWLLKSTKNSRPIIVAPGHRVSIDSSISITKACLRSHKLPEPARLAHLYANTLKRELMGRPHQ